MSEINSQALREAAVAIETVATPQKLLAFRMKVTPQVVLALLDERERNQQYIKRRDQENEDIALTVGKLRVELEAEKQRAKDLFMENYQMNRPCGRPYNATCGMAKEMMSGQQCSCRNNSRNQPSRPSPCPCHLPDAKTRDAEMYTHIDQMEAAMAYVPCQKFTTTYDLGYALKVGTVFPQLCKPFCGKRGGQR